MSTPRKTRSQGPAEEIDLDHPDGPTTAPSWWPNIEEGLVFYGSYHSTLGNKIIHFFCIPIILWTGMLILSQYALSGSYTVVFARGIAYQPSAALLLTVGFQTYYFMLDFIGGLTIVPILSLTYLTATYTRAFPPTWAPMSTAYHPTAIPFAWIVLVLAWVGQFIGHGLFEKRGPALKDNIVLAFVTAPFFLYIQVLFDVFGYKPELRRRVNNRVGARVRAFHRKKD